MLPVLWRTPYKASAAGLDHFKSWLNRGKGIASVAGAETMTKSPDDVTPEEWDKPGPLLFIAPLKGEARAKEKVEKEYDGDWSKLKDTVRGSIAVDSMDDLHGMLDKLRAGGPETGAATEGSLRETDRRGLPGSAAECRVARRPGGRIAVAC